MRWLWWLWFLIGYCLSYALCRELSSWMTPAVGPVAASIVSYLSTTIAVALGLDLKKAFTSVGHRVFLLALGVLLGAAMSSTPSVADDMLNPDFRHGLAPIAVTSLIAFIQIGAIHLLPRLVFSQNEINKYFKADI